MAANVSSSRSGLRECATRYIDLLAQIDAANRRDVDALISMMADDIRYEIPFLTKPLKLEGRETVRTFLNSTQGMFSAVTYDVTRYLVDEDEQAIVVEMQSERTVLPEGFAYSNRYVLIFTIRQGLIADLREYVNPLPAVQIAAKLGLELASQGSAFCPFPVESSQ